MSVPRWARRETILGIHKEQICLHGGVGGILNAGSLDSALARAENFYYYGDQEPIRSRLLARLAACYAYGLIRDHPFIDGNKRTAYATCDFFLRENGFKLTADEDMRHDTILAVAEKKLNEQELARWLEDNIEPMAQPQ